MITLEDVKVPVENLIGEENGGFMLIMLNFNHEVRHCSGMHSVFVVIDVPRGFVVQRFVISAGTCRAARLCFEQAFKFAMSRETFGKPLVSHQLIRFKLAEMARQIEALQDNVERVAYQVLRATASPARYAAALIHQPVECTCSFPRVLRTTSWEVCD